MSANISFTRIGSAIAAIGAILGAAFAVDQRYVHADDFKQQVSAIKDSIVDLHRARLEDEIFRLELIPKNKRSATDNALLDRYKAQIRELDSKRQRQQ